MADNSGPFKLFWPEIDDISSAKAASRLGAWACLIVCVFTGAVLTYKISQSDSASAKSSFCGLH